MIKKQIIIVSLILVILLILITSPWIFILIFGIFEPNPPTPGITYGEFPFRLEYKIDGKTIIVEDVIICEFDGFQWNEGSGKHRVWRKHLKRSNEENVLIIEDGEQKIYCNVGSADYYMNDQKYPMETPFTPNLYPSEGGEFHTQQEIMDKYKIKLIDWKFSEPIKNSFVSLGTRANGDVPVFAHQKRTNRKVNK